MKITAAHLRHSVVLQAPAEVQGDDGHPSLVWTTYATVEAKIWPLSGTERLAGQQVKATATHDITMHFRSDVQRTHRIVFGTRVFDIDNVMNYGEQDRWLIIRCTEVL